MKSSLQDLKSREPTLWRYRELLPLLPGTELSLAEGMTPLLRVESNVRVKDESRSRGTAVSEAADVATQSLAATSGIDVCLEGGAAWSALQTLRERGDIGKNDRAVVFNTGTGLKYR